MSMSMFLSTYAEIVLYRSEITLNILFCSPFLFNKKSTSFYVLYILFFLMVAWYYMAWMCQIYLTTSLLMDLKVVSNFSCYKTAMHILVPLWSHACIFLLERFLRLEIARWKICTLKVLTNIAKLLNGLWERPVSWLHLELPKFLLQESGHPFWGTSCFFSPLQNGSYIFIN